MGMLEIAKRLANKQHGDTRFIQVQAPLEGKPYSCLSALDYGGTESYRGAQMQSGVEVCMWWYEVPSSSCPPSLYIEVGRSRAQTESVTGFRVCTFEYSIYSSLALQGSENILGLGHPKIFMGRVYSYGPSLDWTRCAKVMYPWGIT